MVTYLYLRACDVPHPLFLNLGWGGGGGGLGRGGGENLPLNPPLTILRIDTVDWDVKVGVDLNQPWKICCPRLFLGLGIIEKPIISPFYLYNL